jgi:hypothetical protein
MLRLRLLLMHLLLHVLLPFFLLRCCCCFVGQIHQGCILRARIQVAIAVGDLESREVSPRCRVWSEPSMVEAASFEFSQTEDFLKVLRRYQVEAHVRYECISRSAARCSEKQRALRDPCLFPRVCFP